MYLDPEGVENKRLATVSKKSAWREVKKVIEESDVIVQVLDARDPLGTRSEEIESAVKEYGKKMICVLNKVDLIPADNL